MKMEDIDLDKGWKITLLKIKALKDKADMLQIHMNKLSEKYSISKSVKSCDKNTNRSETNDENTSMVSNGQKQKILYLFYVPGVTKLTSMLFIGSFEVVLLCISPTNMSKVKGTSSIKIIVL